MKNNDIVILSAKRTPIGNLLGNLSSLSAPELGAHSNKVAITSANLQSEDIDEIITGCVLQAGIGQAPARQAAIKAGIPPSVPATTINKMCGSGMKAVMFASDLLKINEEKIILASGMESMSNAPYLLSKARTGYRLNHATLIDHMYLDGLEDAYQPGISMAYFAEETAKRYNFTRQEQDSYAIASLEKALNSQKQGLFAEEISPIHITSKLGTKIIQQDEGIEASKLHKIPTLKPLFTDGSITPASTSSISDGAASLILTTENYAQYKKLTPIAKIVGHATYAEAPEWFTLAPIFAIQKLLTKIKWPLNKIDLFEINEAFAVVTMVTIQELKLNPQKVNIFGGACVLGHPIGASGARIIVTLINALQQTKQKYGIASICIGGGEATAIAIELLS